MAKKKVTNQQKNRCPHQEKCEGQSVQRSIVKPSLVIDISKFHLAPASIDLLLAAIRNMNQCLHRILGKADTTKAEAQHRLSQCSEVEWEQVNVSSFWG